MKSILKEIGRVSFPANTGERVYMLPFIPSLSLPSHLSRWQSTIDAMLVGVRVEGKAYLMINQGFVPAGKSHRRGSPHIDGNWMEDIRAHGGSTSPGRHIVDLPAPAPAPAPTPGHNTGGGRWRAGALKPEAIILASDVSACCAYVGEIDGLPGVGGDCSHLDLSLSDRVNLASGMAYAGNVTMVHESLPVPAACLRTVVRINVPGFEFE